MLRHNPGLAASPCRAII